MIHIVGEFSCVSFKQSDVYWPSKKRILWGNAYPHEFVLNEM